MFIYNFFTTDSSFSEKLISILAALMAIFIAIVVHEVSHGYAALWNGDPTAKNAGRLTLNPVVHFNLLGVLMMLIVGFGWAKPVPVNPANFKNHKRGMIAVSVAGVLSNLVMGGLGLLLLYLLNPIFYMTVGSSAGYILKLLLLMFLVYFVGVNFMLAMFNLLPIYPLDGFNLVNTLLPRGNAYQTFMVRYGMYILLGLLVLGQIGDLIGLPFLNIFGLFSNLIRKLISIVLAAN
jgi:Zn-dependent protease